MTEFPKTELATDKFQPGQPPFFCDSSTFSIPVTSSSMHLAERPPSSTWEQIPLADAPHCRLWAWFKPPAAPQGVFLRIPEESFRDPQRRQPISLRCLLHSLGLDPQSVSVWSLYGTAYDAQPLANPAWDYPIPEPGAASDPSIGIYLKAVSAPVPNPVAAAAAQPTRGRLRRSLRGWKPTGRPPSNSSCRWTPPPNSSTRP